MLFRVLQKALLPSGVLANPGEIVDLPDGTDGGETFQPLSETEIETISGTQVTAPIVGQLNDLQTQITSLLNELQGNQS